MGRHTGESLQPGTYAPAFCSGGGMQPGSVTEGHATSCGRGRRIDVFARHYIEKMPGHFYTDSVYMPAPINRRVISYLKMGMTLG